MGVGMLPGVGLLVVPCRTDHIPPLTRSSCLFSSAIPGYQQLRARITGPLVPNAFPMGMSLVCMASIPLVLVLILLPTFDSTS